MIKDRGSITEAMKGGGEILPQGVSFDGTSDYLSRSSDLVGNVDSKTFTFSCWVYTDLSKEFPLYSSGNIGFAGWITTTGRLYIFGRNSSATNILSFNLDKIIPKNTWTNILISIDLSDTGKRHLYVNDKLISPTWTTYTNALIDFTQTKHQINYQYDDTTIGVGRHSNYFLDYTYRDLSIEANRRLFITADGKPADGLGLVDKYLSNKGLTTNATVPRDIRFSSDGLKATVVNQNNTYGLINYTLTEPFNCSTMVYSSQITTSSGGTFPFSYDFSLDGLKGLYLDRTTPNVYSMTNHSGAFIAGYSVNSTYNLSAAEVNPLCVRWNNNGTKFYVSSGTDSRSIKAFNLSTPYNVSTVSSYSTVLDTIATSTIRNDSFDFNTNGTSLVVLSSYDKKIAIYQLSTAYDISSAVFSHLISIPTIAYSGGSVQSISYRHSSNFIHTIDYNNDTVYGLYTFIENNKLNVMYGQSANNPQQPILYLPMKDAETAHINLGTGWDFVQNGTLATADRGANQDNCVASKFDGVDDYMTANITTSNSGLFTCSFNSKAFSQTTDEYIFGGGKILIRFDTLGQLRILLRKTDLTNLVTITVPSFLLNINRNISMSFDLSDTLKRHLHVDGVEINPTYTSYINDVIEFGGTDFRIGSNTTAHIDGEIGEVYLNSEYIDLSTNNPFWDSETNKPIPVRKAMANLGSNPLICSPISADNPTANYGSGGQWTLNGGGLVGARGASEFIARSITGTSAYLENTSVIPASDSDTATLIIAFKTPSSFGNDAIFDIENIEHTGNTFYAQITSSGTLRIAGRNSSYTNIYTRDSSVLSASTWYVALFSGNINSGIDHYYISNVSQPDATLETTSSTFGFSTTPVSRIGGNYGGGGLDATSALAFTYFTTDYIDFSQEANRNLFVNQLGYPRDLTPEIEAGNIPQPLFYLKFDDPSNLGIDSSGNNNHFTVNGTVTAGADFSI